VSLILQSGARLPDTLSFRGEEMNNGATITYAAPYSVPLSYQQDVFGRSNLFDLSPVNNQAVWPSGTGVSLLIFPAMPAASSEVLKHLLYLANEGVPLLLQSTIPSRTLGLNDTDSEVVALATQLWNLAGNGNVFVNQTAAAVLSFIGVAPDMTYTSSSNDAAIYFGHNIINGEDVYFLTNQLRKPVDVVVSLRAVGTPLILDPATGQSMQPASWSTDSGRTDIGLSLKAHESIFVWITKSSSPSKQMRSISKDGIVLYRSTQYTGFTTTPWPNVSGTFTLSTWAKPVGLTVRSDTSLFRI
jgi:alpha-L-rhamnosidase